MAKEIVLNCHKCGQTRDHVRIHVGDLHDGHPFIQTVAAPLADAVMKVVNVGDWTGMNPYMCKACGHYRNRGSKCADTRCS
jgi:hypothetical protein